MDVPVWLKSGSSYTYSGLRALAGAGVAGTCTFGVLQHSTEVTVEFVH